MSSWYSDGVELLSDRLVGLLAFDAEPTVPNMVSFELDSIPNRQPRCDLQMNECNDAGYFLSLRKYLRDVCEKVCQLLFRKRLRFETCVVCLRST